MPNMEEFIAALPKVELHVHLEGTLEAKMKFKLAARNGMKLPYRDVQEMEKSYIYHDLPSFLAVFYEGAKVMIEEEDFFDLCYAYLTKAASQNVLYAEMFFDPQQHTDRGVPFEKIISGLTRARKEAEADLGIKSALIMCFVRERSAESAMATLKSALPFKHLIAGIGLDSDEKDNPPAKFAEAFALARAEGLHLTMHCDVDQVNTHEHIRQAIVDVGVDRIDHGANLLDDPKLVNLALERNIPLTVCPFANEIVRPKHGQDVVRRMIDLGLKVTLNSDDPAYMGGRYIAENIQIAQRGAGLTQAELIDISRNAIDAAWVGDSDRAELHARLDAFVAQSA